MGIFRDEDDPERPEVGGGLEATGKVLPLLPLRDIVVFPFMVVPLFVGRAKSIQALEEAMAGHRELMLCAQREAAEDEPSPKEIYEVGTLGSIIQLLRLPDGTVKVLAEGKSRGRIKRFLSDSPYFSCEVEPIDDEQNARVETEALVRAVHSTFENYVKLNKKVPPETLNTVGTIADPSRLADTVVAHLNLKLEERQELLETFSPAKRGRAQDPRPREEADGALAEGVLPQRADAGDPEGARGAGRVQERD
jgi:ATP-dependent Lon protease